MESNIKKLSMREILSRVGFPITINEFRNTYKFNVDLDVAMEFESQLKQINRMSEIEKIICRYENIFDKEIYVFHLARLLEKDIENMKRAELLGERNVEQLVFTNDITGKNKRRFFVNAKNLLKKCDVIDIVMKKKAKGEFEIYFSMDFVEQNTEFSEHLEYEAERKLAKIEQEIGLENVLKYIEQTDLSDICRYSNLAMLLMVEHGTLESKVRRYAQYMDFDKMLVLANAVYFYKYGENFYNFSKEEAIELKEFTDKISKVVGNNVKFIQVSKFYFTIDYAEIKEKIKKLLDYNENIVLKENNESIIEKETEELTKDIIENEMPIEPNVLVEEFAEEQVEEDIFKTEVIKSEETENKIIVQTEEVIGDIFELANLEDKIIETTLEIDSKEFDENNNEIKSETENEIETETEIETENEIETETEIETENEVEIETEIETENEVEIETESEIESKVEEIEENSEKEFEETINEEVSKEEIGTAEVIENVNENIEEKIESQDDANSSFGNKYFNNLINNTTKIVMNFENRKNTIFKLDESYSQEILDDGTTIFSLPNKACYIIEISSSKEDFCGNATYIINKDLFDEKRNSLIENEKLKQKELSMLKLNNHKDVTKLVYTGWENAINTFFNMKTEEKYTEEEKANISRIIEKING